MDRSQAKIILKGPVPSIRTPFDIEGNVDFEGLRSNIDFLLGQGVNSIMLTAGDSHYDCLTDEEISNVTRITAQHTAGRAKLIAADRYHTTSRAVEFAKFVSGIGADILMCLPPDWAQSCTSESLSEHYAEVSKYVPVMVVTNRFMRRSEEFALETIEKSLQKSESVVAVKDDLCGQFAWRLGILAQKYNVATISGGRKSNHMNMLPYGVDGYLSTFINFKPEVAIRYYNAIEINNIESAAEIIAEIDIPFFDYIINYRGGYDAAIHAVMELFGIYKRYRRRPYYSYNDHDMEKLQEFLRSLKLL